MLNVYRSNRLERLVDELAAILRVPPADDPLRPEWIAVQSQGMRSWLELQLLEPGRLEIWCNVWLPFPRGLIDAILTHGSGTADGADDAFEPDTLVWTIVALLDELLPRRGFEPLRRYLDDDPRGVKRYQLAARIAGTFDEYALYRGEMVHGWERDRPTDDWQPQLWNAILDHPGERDHVTRRFERFRRRLERGGVDWSGLPRRIALFGVSSLPPLYLRVLAGLPAEIDVNLFVLSPSRQYWADIGRRLPRGTEIDAAELEQHLEVGHPLLASLGRLGQHFQAVLEGGAEYLEPAGDLYAPPRFGASGRLLHGLQDDMLELRHRRPDAGAGDAPPATIAPDDDSITVHCCHGPKREVEVLRDRLLALFDDARLGLEPHEVLVLSPSLERYAPYVEAVFGASDPDGGPAIPFRIVGRGARQQAPVVDAFLGLLSLVRGRVGLQEVLDLLTAAPIRERFRLSPGDVALAQRWAEEAGVRWGIDPEHRARHGQPPYAENTWRFGLDRLLLGYAVPDGERALFGGVVPHPEIEGSATEVLGAFVEFWEELVAVLRTLDGALPIAAWRERLGAALERLIDRAGDRADQHALILEALRDLATRLERAGHDGPLDLDVLREVLGARLSSASHSRYRTAGAVTVGELKPLRGIPARVVCLLGLDGETFPRSGHPSGFDLMSQRPRIGDRSVRDDDRYLFLETLLAARERLIVSYVGRDIQTNRVLPPSVLVSELLDAIGEGYRLAGEGEPTARIVVEHPLQPFSPRYFERGAARDERLFSYAGGCRAGVQALLTGGEPPAPFFDEGAPLPPPPDRSVLRLDDLARFFKQPCEYLLRQGLGIYISDEADGAAAEDREPFELGYLERYAIGSQLIERALAGDDLTGYLAVERGRGRLPLGTAGRRVYFDLVEQAQPIAAALAAARSGAALEPLAVDLDLDTAGGPTRLVGVLDGLTTDARVQHSFGRSSPRRLLDLWIRHLALACVAPDGYPRRSLWFGYDGAQVDLLPVEDGARRLLSRLVELYWIGLQRPLRFFPATSRAYAWKMLSPNRKSQETPQQTAAQALKNAYREWTSTRHKEFADGANASVRRFFGARRPLEDDDVDPPALAFKALALEVFAPVFAHLDRGRST